MIINEFGCYEVKIEEVAWVRLPVTAGFFTFLYFASSHPNLFISSVRQDALSIEYIRM